MWFNTLGSGDCYAALGVIVHPVHDFKGAATRFEEVPGTRYQRAPFDSVRRGAPAGVCCRGIKTVVSSQLPVLGF